MFADDINLCRVPMHIQLYFFPGFKYTYIYIQNYITCIFECDVVTLFSRNNIPNFHIIYIYGLIGCISYLFFVAPYCNVTVPLFQHCVISNGPLYGVSYLKSVILLIMTLSPALYLWSTLLLFLWMLYLCIFAFFL